MAVANTKTLPLEPKTCIEGLLFPDGETSGTSRKNPVRVRNARVSRSLDLTGKRVLDVGCGTGLYTLYLAESAKEVIGIDHQQSRIDVAEGTRRRLRIDNVSFRTADIRDTGLLRDLGMFDLVLMWGFLHRIPDLFSPLYHLAEITEAFSLEWTTPVFPFMGRASLAAHRTEVDEIDTSNLLPPGELTPEEITDRKIAGNSGYWFPAPGVVKEILRKCGHSSARILGYDEDLCSERQLLLRRLGQHILRRPRNRYARVHMIAERSPGAVTFNQDLSEAMPPIWDVAARNYLNYR